MSSSSLNSKDRFPFWATFTITAVVLVFVGVYASGVLTIQASQRFYKELTDTKNATLVARSIAQFPDKLPDGYAFRFGASITADQVMKWFGFPSAAKPSREDFLMGYNIITLESTADDQQVIIVSKPELETKTAKEQLQSAYDFGGSPSPTSLRFNAAKTHGEEIIAGHPMPYIIGNLEDGSGRKLEGLIGCITLEHPDRTILIYGMQKIGGKYDLGETLDLLKSIKGF
jgi:hypothetical protein